MSEAIKAIDEYVAKGGKLLFWSCPRGCHGMVNWDKVGERHVATCGACGLKSSDPRPDGIKTKHTDPDHHTVGHYFGGHSFVTDGPAIYWCDSYDPRCGYWLTNIKNDLDRKNVSERAIGRTFHEAYDKGDHFWVTQWGIKVPK